MRPLFAELWIRTLTKADLDSLIIDLKKGDPEAESNAVTFLTSESLGIWHNRARAKICRHLKNHPPTSDAFDLVVDTIVKRLLTGNFYAQFKDQLAFAIRHAPDRLRSAAEIAAKSNLAYIRRYGEWVLQRVEITHNAKNSK